MKMNERIVEYRNRRNLTQADVAARAGLNIKHYQSIERGDIQPRLKSLLKIANAIGIPFDLLCIDAGKDFLLYAAVACLDTYNDDELQNVYDILGAYLDE